MTRGFLGVSVLLGLSLVDGLYATPVVAQITAAPDGTGTEVRRTGDRITIQGGTLSRDQQNLFHSFEQFGLSASDVATFLSNPQIQNILGRVTGGHESVINGLLQVTGGNSNLYLMNPAGILFGPNARLDLPGSFTATTATGIGFGGSRFNAISPSDYANLVGTPNEFIFATYAPGAIANLGDLAVNAGEGLTLLGGTVVNAGTLTAPGGRITIAAVPGQNAVRVSQDGLLLSLELQRWQDEGQGLDALPFTPLTLAQLLTGGNLDNASTLTVNPDGSVSLAGSPVILPSTAGTAIASGTLTTSSPTPNPQSLTPEINVLGDRVALLSATLDASGINGGGTVRIGGDYQGQGSVFNSDRTLIDRNSTISANALQTGDGGRVIVWADGVTRFDGSINARGGDQSGNGGFVEVSGRDNLDFSGLVDVGATAGVPGQLLLDPTSVIIQAAGLNDLELNDQQILAGDILGAVFALSTTALLNALNSGNVQIAATSNIDVNTAINTSSNATVSDLTLTAPIINLSNSITLNGGNITLDGAVATPAGAVNINSGGAGTIAFTQPINANVGLGTSGTVRFAQGFVGGSIGISASQLEVAGNYLGDHGFGGLPVTLIGDTLFGGAGSTSISFGNTINLNTHALTIQSGAIQISNLSGLSGSSVNLNGPVTVVGNAAITADEINFANPVSGTGNLTLAPATVNQAIALGNTTDSGISTLDLLNTDLTALQNGFSSITIGRADGSGVITLGNNVTFNDPTVLRSPLGNGTINTQGFSITGDTSLTLQAGDSITVDTGTTLTSNGGAIAVTLNADRDGSGAGPIVLNPGASIISNGGNVILGGGADPLLTPAQSNDAVSVDGIAMNGTINAGGGNISLVGQSNSTGALGVDGNTGIRLRGALTTTGTGAITLNGTSGTGALNQRGINILSPSATITTVDGAIALTGLGRGTQFNNEGILIRNGSVIQSTGQGTITLQGTGATNNNDSSGIIIFQGGASETAPRITSANGDISLLGIGQAGNNVGLALSTAQVNSTGTGSIIFTADEIDLFNSSIQGSANLIVQPNRFNQAIALGGATDRGVGTLDLSGTDLAALTNGFSSITIGRTDGSGGITLGGDVTFNDPVTLQAPVGTGSINTNGFGITGSDNATLNLLASQTITTGALANPGRAITATSTNGGITTGNITTQVTNGVGGPVTLNAFNRIQTGDIDTWVNGGSGGNLNLTLNGNNGSITTGRIWTLTFDFNSGGDININANGGTVTTGSIDSYANRSSGQGGDIVISGGNISTGDLNNNGLSGLGPLDARSGIITFNATGTITTGTINNKDSPITFNGALALNRDIAIRGFGTGSDITFSGLVNGSQNLTVDARAGNVVFANSVGSVAPLNNLAVSSSGTTQFNGSVNAASLTTDAGGSTTLNGNVTTNGATGQTYNDAVTVLGTGVLTADEITFAAPVSGTGRLTLQPFTNNQAIALGGSVDTGTATLDLLASDLNNLQPSFSSISIGRTTSTGTVTLNPTTLTVPVTIIGGSTLVGPDQATTWSITGQGVSNVSGLGATVGFTNIENLIGGSEDDTFAFANGATFTGAIAGGAGNNTLDYSTSTSNLTWILDGPNQGAIGSTDFSNIQNLTNGSGNATVIFNAGAILTGNIAGGEGNLTLRGDDIEFGGTVSGTGDLAIQPDTLSQRIRVGGSVDFPDTLNLSSTEISQLQDGFASITIGRLNGTGETIVNAVSFTDPTTIRNELIGVNGAIAGFGDASLRFVGETTLNASLSTDNQSIFFNNAIGIGDNTDVEETGITINTGDTTGDIIFGSTVNGLSANDNRLTLQTAGLVRFNGTVGEGVPLGRLEVTAPRTEVGANLNASTIVFNGPVAVLDSAVISAGRGILNVNDTLTADTNNLTLAAGEINLLGGENSVSGSGRLTLRQGNGGQAIEIGNVIFSDDAALNLTPTDLAALADGFSGITIEQIEGSGDIFLDTSTFRDPLTLRTASGFIFYDDDVTLPSGTSVAIDSTQPIVLRRNITTQGNSLVFNSDVELRGDVTLDTSSGNNAIVFAGAVNGDRPLTLRAGLGSIRLRGIVGDSTPLASLQLDSAESAEIRGNVTTNGNIQLNVPVSIFNNAVLNARGAIAATQLMTGAESSSVNLSADGPIDVQDITAPEGGLSLRSGGNLTARTLTARQAIALTSGSTLSTGDITSSGGNISLDGANINLLGNITSGGGDISLTSRDAAVTQALNSSNPTRGGAITIRATNRITTGQINSSSVNGDGGNVLLDPLGDVQVEAIDARGGSNGRGGSVTVIAGQYFRAIGTIPDLAPPTSISTAGGLGGGNIFIRHGGGGDVPFVVGANTQNGTLGAITTGTDTISPPQTFFGDLTLGGIQINTGDTTCVLQCPPPPPPPPPPLLPEVTFTEAQGTLRRVLDQTGVQPALVYVGFIPDQSSIDIGFEQREANSTQDIERYLGRSGSAENLGVTFQAKESDRLEIVIVTSSGNPIRRQVDGVTRADLQRVTRQLLGQITDSSREHSTVYLAPAQQLYKWLIAPIEADLQQQNIDNLSFVMDAGLRFVPLAALHDGQQFLVEKYSVGLMPSLALTDTRRVDLRNTQVLAMGASQFTNQQPLPAVPVELAEINTIWEGESFLNTNFTPENLKLQREQRPFGIIHLATHAEFNRGTPENSYIQFWNEKLGLDQIRQLGLNNPPVELLVLSACRTALGNEEAELGFAGFAVQAGVRSVLASLWSVSDIGTLALMSEFYEQLRTAPTRTEALRRAQIALLRGQVTIRDGQLITSGGRQITLPPELLSQTNVNLPYPLYWAAFTMIGNPW